MSIREAETADAERVREVASSAMSSAYAISPAQIETIVEEEFGDDAFQRKVESEETILRVVAVDADEADTAGDVSEGDVIGVGQATVDGDRADVRWLFVDPEFWDLGHGSDLFEAVGDGAREAGAEEIRGLSITQNEQFHDYFEKFGLERAGEREVEIGGEEFVEQIYARDGDSPAGGDRQDSATEARGGGDIDEDEDTGTREAAVDVPETTTGEDGQEVYLDRDDPMSGMEAPFFQTYTDPEFENPYSYFCGNCGSTDVAMDNMERIECENCGNEHRDREEYDGSYL